MKKTYLLISIAIFTLISCNKNDSNTSTNLLVGTWKYTEMYADPGNGSGVFTPVTSTKTITFDATGNVTSNGSLCDMSTASNASSTGTYTAATNTLIPTSCPNTTIIYELIGTTLILNYPCIEPCKAKFIKVP
ncbi:lipocalin-like domain-containing protein [Flavobacterium aciduliphilum]|uniref:Lipocalin-like protein n=1 Tax=Flavobacterium aciduliphilum TaxID=1101402 RepID=A0A328YFX9_9FLAO|nr:lipocalin family protein [Flavobacterium aciduliphilum]RAR70872.1 lipocalin-like protein [Flavobacterium aciduliphilum]